MSKTIAQKLSIKKDHRVMILNAPEGYRESLGDLPEGSKLVSSAAKEADVIQVFVSSLPELQRALSDCKKRLAKSGILWITYPKGTGQAAAGIHRDIIREQAQSIGMDTVAIFSVDAKWSGLRLKIVAE